LLVQRTAPGWPALWDGGVCPTPSRVQTCPARKGLFSGKKSCSRYGPNTQLSSMDLTYKIIGADTHEYGPVSLLELKKWVSEGRITGATQVSRSDQEGWSTAAHS